ncbi:MAG: carbonic anhydrase, partial [Bryobacteraceae bacterium]|nr:carbonic anhydrase [Bryobacteraceae bacterium]
MRRLLEGLVRFHNEVYPSKRELFESLAQKQTPHSLFITCSDSRIVPDLLTGAEPGDLFIIR